MLAASCPLSGANPLKYHVPHVEMSAPSAHLQTDNIPDVVRRYNLAAGWLLRNSRLKLPGLTNRKDSSPHLHSRICRSRTTSPASLAQRFLVLKHTLRGCIYSRGMPTISQLHKIAD